MLGCESMVTAVASSEVVSHPGSPDIVVSGAACASMHSHDCCAKSHTGSAAQPSGRSLHAAERTIAPSVLRLGPILPTMIDCPLAVNALAVLSKAGPDALNVAAPAVIQRAIASHLPELSYNFACPLRPANRGHTYLRLCVFLI